jgi:hypothetical protein
MTTGLCATTGFRFSAGSTSSEPFSPNPLSTFSRTTAALSSLGAAFFLFVKWTTPSASVHR